MRREWLATGLAVVTVFGSISPSWSVNPPKAGYLCKKVGKIQTFKGKTFTCVKSGKKVIWRLEATKSAAPAPAPVLTGSPSPTPIPTPTITPTPTPTLAPTPSPSPTPASSPTPLVTPKSFADLYENRKGVSFAAWKKSSDIMARSKPKVGALEIHTGPNTTPFFDDYLSAVSLVSRLFPGRLEPSKNLIIRYNYQDLAWAEKLTKEKLTPDDYANLQRNEQNQLVGSNCDAATRNCRGSKKQTETSTGLAIILQGVEKSLNPFDSTANSRFKTGMLEAHEYFHALQRIPIMGKTQIWPHAWFREGSAEWVQNMAINYNDFQKYNEFLRLDCTPICLRLTESQIIEFFETSKENYTPPKFDRWLNYSLSGHVIEALVAIKGPDTLLELYEQMGKKLSFEQAFKETYGVEWSYALPILAKTVYANLNGL